MMATMPGGADIPCSTAHVTLIVCLPLVELDEGRMERADVADDKPIVGLCGGVGVIHMWTRIVDLRRRRSLYPSPRGTSCVLRVRNHGPFGIKRGRNRCGRTVQQPAAPAAAPDGPVMRSA